MFLLAVVGRTDACSVFAFNDYNVSITVNSYNNWDSFCTAWYNSKTIDAGGYSTSMGCIRNGLSDFIYRTHMISIASSSYSALLPDHASRRA
jgi:hypothetical protein